MNFTFDSLYMIVPFSDATTEACRVAPAVERADSPKTPPAFICAISRPSTLSVSSPSRLRHAAQVPCLMTYNESAASPCETITSPLLYSNVSSTEPTASRC